MPREKKSTKRKEAGTLLYLRKARRKRQASGIPNVRGLGSGGGMTVEQLESAMARKKENGKKYSRATMQKARQSSVVLPSAMNNIDPLHDAKMLASSGDLSRDRQRSAYLTIHGRSPIRSAETYTRSVDPDVIRVGGMQPAFWHDKFDILERRRLLERKFRQMDAKGELHPDYKEAFWNAYDTKALHVPFSGFWRGEPLRTIRVSAPRAIASSIEIDQKQRAQDTERKMQAARHRMDMAMAAPQRDYGTPRTPAEIAHRTLRRQQMPRIQSVKVDL